VTSKKRVTRKPRRTGDDAKAHLLGVACRMFYARGIHSVGVDEIARAAEMAPTTMYRCFQSKDALISAYASAVDNYWRTWFTKAILIPTDPIAQIRSVFCELCNVVKSPDHRGCPFTMLLAEYPEPTHPAHVTSVANKKWAREQFGKLCAAAQFADVDSVADQLVILMDGLYTNNQSLGPDGPVSSAMSLVDLILSAKRSTRRLR
jgi:AcrR family transcriptional regulator